MVMKLEAKNAMLRIAVQRMQDVDTWILEGRIAGRTADELSASWKKTHNERIGRKCVIDLVDVTSVDELGERALMEMMAEGAQFVIRGVYTRSLVENLTERSKREI
jgi:anti-anti-sigma regulatory factor